MEKTIGSVSELEAMIADAAQSGKNPHVGVPATQFLGLVKSLQSSVETVDELIEVFRSLANSIGVGINLKTEEQRVAFFTDLQKMLGDELARYDSDSKVEGHRPVLNLAGKMVIH